MQKYGPWIHWGASLALALVTTLPTSLAVGQEESQPPASATTDDAWYYRPAPTRAEPKSIAQQKAELRAAQRMQRLEALRWYGFSNSRPTATAMPFTTMYSPAWQQPGGRPFAWHMSSRPVVIYHTIPAFYR
jgi:hypothetical protein